MYKLILICSLLCCCEESMNSSVNDASSSPSVRHTPNRQNPIQEHPTKIVQPRHNEPSVPVRQNTNEFCKLQLEFQNSNHSWNNRLSIYTCWLEEIKKKQISWILSGTVCKDNLKSIRKVLTEVSNSLLKKEMTDQHNNHNLELLLFSEVLLEALL